jgi:bifunctional DNA-binding transcriptional regulator/antitoxin component of YhaV-PrlF toxin-antitoxin module
MRTTINLTSKWQLTLPAKVRQDMGLGQDDTKVTGVYDPAAKRFYIEKPTSIDQLNSMNQKILKERQVSATDYKSGDGFRRHVAKSQSHTS